MYWCNPGAQPKRYIQIVNIQIYGCLKFHNSLIFTPLIKVLSYAYSTFTAIFKSFFLVVCVILAETLDFLIAQNLSCNFYQGWVKLHISAVSYLINLLPPKGTPLMLNVLIFQLVPRSSLPCRHDRISKMPYQCVKLKPL